MKHIRLFMVLGFLASAFIGFLSAGTGDLAFQMPAAMAVLTAIAPLLPKPQFSIPGLSRADLDPVEQIKELTRTLGETRAELTKQQTELKDAHRQVMDSVEKGLKLDKETQDSIDKAIAQANGTSLEMGEVSKKLDDLKKIGLERQMPEDVRSQIEKQLGGELKEKHSLVINREAKSLKIVLKDITSASVSTGMKREPYIDSLVSLERRPLRIRDLLTVIPVQTDSVKYGQQTIRDNQARIVAEGTAKPYSNYKWESRTASIETIAHLTKMTLQALADAPRLAAEVESEMRYGLAYAEENELLNGDGTTGHLSGLIENATPYQVPLGMMTGDIITGVDRLRVAMLQIHLAFAQPDAHVLNPINMAELELLRRDPDNGGGYLFGNPDANTGVLRLWRLPTVETAAMTVGRFLTGAFKYSAHLYDRMGVQVLISTENDTDFENNEATMRVESRIGLGVRRPYGLVEGALGTGGS